MENNLRLELKNLFTSYWHFLALQKACQIGIFDVLANKPCSIIEITTLLQMHQQPLVHLLAFLTEQNYLTQQNNLYYNTEKGLLLTDQHPQSLKNACILWGEEHLTAWQQLDFTLKTGEPSFEQLFHQPFFDYLSIHKTKLQNYHLAMRDYARDDYKELTTIVDFAKHNIIADVGGSIGTLINYIAIANPQCQCILFDLPSVTTLVEQVKEQNFSVLSGSFFSPLPFVADAIVLSRVLHDWNNEKALQILQHCKNALLPNGRLYVIEIMNNEIQAHLLSLNMMIMCKSFERTFAEYQTLLYNAGFELVQKLPLNSLQTILICK